MSSSFSGQNNIEGSLYTGDFRLVPVDNSGFYDEPVAMEELCYCVGIASVKEDGIYAAHISPGEIGASPEELLNDFEEGQETYVVAGFLSEDYDSEFFDYIISEIDGSLQAYTASEFVLNEEGEIFEGFEKNSKGSFLSSNI